MIGLDSYILDRSLIIWVPFWLISVFESTAYLKFAKLPYIFPLAFVARSLQGHVWQFGFPPPPPGVVLQEEYESVQKRAASFVTGYYSYKTGSMTGGILGQLKRESLKKRRKDNRLILLYKGLKGKASVPTDDLIPKTRRARNQHSMAFQTPIANTDDYKDSFFPPPPPPRLSGIGMPSPILWSHLLKTQRIVLLSSLLWWELGTNSLITGPGEVSDCRFGVSPVNCPDPDPDWWGFISRNYVVWPISFLMKVFHGRVWKPLPRPRCRARTAEPDI